MYVQTKVLFYPRIVGSCWSISWGMGYTEFQHSKMQSMDKLFCFKHTVALTEIFSYHLQLGVEIMATSYRTWLQSYRTVIFSSNNKHQSLYQAIRVGWYSPPIQKFIGFIWLIIDHGNNISVIFTACMYAIHSKTGYLLGIWKDTTLFCH
jgi:hypothetical protein